MTIPKANDPEGNRLYAQGLLDGWERARREVRQIRRADVAAQRALIRKHKNEPVKTEVVEEVPVDAQPCAA